MRTVSVVAAIFLLTVVNLQRDKPMGTVDRLTEYAIEHSQQMATAGDLYHSEVSNIPGTYVGENVGVGPSIDSVTTALLASPGHYSNIVDPRFTATGAGVVESDGLVWVTQVFSDLESTHGDAAMWALSEGLLKGFPDGTFRPNEPVTRGQLATVLERLAGLDTQPTTTTPTHTRTPAGLPGCVAATSTRSTTVNAKPPSRSSFTSRQNPD